MKHFLCFLCLDSSKCLIATETLHKIGDKNGQYITINCEQYSQLCCRIMTAAYA